MMVDSVVCEPIGSPGVEKTIRRGRQIRSRDRAEVARLTIDADGVDRWRVEATRRRLKAETGTKSTASAIDKEQKYWSLVPLAIVLEWSDRACKETFSGPLTHEAS